jgi:hypothetical protein
MTWPTTADGQYYLFEGQVLIPVNPSTGVAQLILRPVGGMLVGVPAIEQGDPGQPANFSTTVNFTELAYDDPTAAGASLTELTPPTESTPGLYRLNYSVHAGPPGDDGAALITPDDYGTPVYGQLLSVNTGADGFELVYPKVGDSHTPASLNDTASGNPNSTLGLISIAPNTYPFDWRPRVSAYTVVTGEAADVRVDLVARLNGETGGNIIGRCPGIAQTERLTLIPGKPAGSGDAWDRVAANAAATIHLRCERQAGSVTYTTSATTTWFTMEVQPIL